MFCLRYTSGLEEEMVVLTNSSVNQEYECDLFSKSDLECRLYDDKPKPFIEFRLMDNHEKSG